MDKTTLLKPSVAALLAAAFTLAGCAPVTISSSPPQARVYNKRSDKLVGTTPVKLNLVASTREVVVRKDGFFSQTVVLSPIDPDNITVALRRRDKVLLLSNPDGAELHVEGAGRVGRTPYLLDYDKPFRTFTVRAPGYASVLFTIPEDPEGNVLVDLVRDATVVVESKPRNAWVLDADGRTLGETPLAVPAAGKGTFLVRKEGYYPREFSVDAGTQSPLVVELEREPIIILSSNPDGAVVVHRGVALGRTPYRHLVAADMELEIVADRHYSKQLVLTPESPRHVNVRLDPKPYIVVRSEPGSAMLYRSGGVEQIGATPVEILVEKDSAFEMYLDGYTTRAFTLSPNSRREVVVPLAKAVESAEKTVVIDSEPSGALVYRPGGAELIGKTPLEQHLRSERSFELHFEGFKTKIVTVAPDSADKVVIALAKDESARNITVSDPLLNTPLSF